MTRPGSAAGVFGRLIAPLAGALALVLGFMFSLVVLGLVLVAGLGAGVYFWWKTRALRKAARAQAPVRGRASGGQVIDGEATVVEEFTVKQGQVLAADPDTRQSLNAPPRTGG